MGHAHANADHGCNGCKGAATSIDTVFEGEDDLEASARNKTVVALTAGATVFLPDDMESGAVITIAAPNGAVNLRTPENVNPLPAALATVAGGTFTKLMFIESECGCGTFISCDCP